MRVMARLESPRWGALFFAAALVSYALALDVLRGDAADVARMLFFLFLVAAIAVALKCATRETP